MRLYCRHAGLFPEESTTLPLDHHETICVATRLFIIIYGCCMRSSASLGPLARLNTAPPKVYGVAASPNWVYGMVLEG